MLAYNAVAAPDAANRIAAALGDEDASAGLADLRAALAAPRALRELGLREEDLPAAVAAVLPAVPPGNPRPVDAAALARLLRRLVGRRRSGRARAPRGATRRRA